MCPVTCMLSSYPVRMIFRFHFKWAATLKANNLKALTFLFSFMKTLTSENRESNFNTSTTYYKHFISEREQTTFSIHQRFLKYLFITWSLRWIIILNFYLYKPVRLDFYQYYIFSIIHVVKIYTDPSIIMLIYSSSHLYMLFFP